jgi:hypothetical protein
MRAADLGVVRPRQIDEIRAAAARRVFEEMKAKATTAQDYMGLANVYAEQNDRLTKQIAALEDERDAMLLRLQNAEAQLRYRAPVSEEIAPEPSDDRAQVEASPPPESGKELYYKKVHAAPMYDIMIRVGECGHNNWENAHSADKARKGIAKLEGGRSDWKRLQHCAICTGGGVWRVKW